MPQAIPLVITTTHNDPALISRRDWFMHQPGCEWVEGSSRNTKIPTLIISRKGVCIETEAQRLSFHPSMALLRLMNIFRDNPDRFLEATGLKAGDVMLDATLGLATDALVAAWAVGPGGRVIGVEKSPVLAAVVRDGLLHFPDMIPHGAVDKQKVWQALAEAAGRIDVVWSDHLDFLRRQPADSADVVFFDPMFRHTRPQSASIQPLHFWSDPRSIDPSVIHEATRAARHRIVLKERKGSKEFTRLGFQICAGGRYSSVDYGVIPV